MKITLEFQGQHRLDVQLADWNKLAGLPRVRTVYEVRALFYPGLEPDVDPCSSDTRRRDFFPDVDDVTYLGLYRTVLSEPGRRFIDIQALLRTTKQEGKLMSIVMSHVTLWMNAEPAKVSDRDNNKPALRKDLVPALQAKYGDKADEKSRVLQQAVLDYVHENAKDFASTTLEHYLHKYPSGDDETYGKRFEHKVWREVLSIVTIYAGPSLQHKYIASPIPEEAREIRPPTIAQTARDLICQIPEVASDPALRSATAAEQLLRMMQPVIAQWISKQHVDASDPHSEDGQPSAVDLADEQHAEKGLFRQSSRSHAARQGQPLAAAQNRRPLPWAQNASSTHRSVQEPAAAQIPSSGSTAASDAGVSPPTEMEDPVLIDFSLDGLNKLRKQHRHRSAISQQTTQLQQHSLHAEPHQPKHPSTSLSSRATTGSGGHWRQRASARRGK